MVAAARRLIGVLLALGLAAPAHAGATNAARAFAAQRTASPQPPMPIGSYARGCLSGGIRLPESGPGWQVMRPSRNRNWGHPALIAFIGRLARAAQDAGWKGIYVGDLSQPRGGPMPSGHRSHQIGLDADIWMLPPRRLDLSRAERETISSISVRTRDQRRVNANWTPRHMRVLKAAAKDPAVDRIFVAAAVKIEMCRTAGRDRAWLQKIRPFYGHDTHFHVRLKCPPGASLCETQTPGVRELSKGGDGCDETLRWWVTDYLEALARPRKPGRADGPRRKRASEFTLGDLPAACRGVLAAR